MKAKNNTWINLKIHNAHNAVIADRNKMKIVRDSAQAKMKNPKDQAMRIAFKIMKTDLMN
jgi:hypothetical protein